MSEMLLLGAGASVSAGVPGAYAMSAKMVEILQKDFRFRRHGRVLSFVVGGLLFQAGKRGENPLSAGVNVEDLFNAVQLLAQRRTLEAAPFVGSWDEMVEELDRPESSSGNLDRIINESLTKQVSKAFSKIPSPPSEIDRAFQNGLVKAVKAAPKQQIVSVSSSESIGRGVQKYLESLGRTWKEELGRSSSGVGNSADLAISKRLDNRTQKGEGRIFDETNQLMIAALKDLVWIEKAEKISYLGPILNLLDKQQHLTVATLNYDNAVELLCGSQCRSLGTGIEEWTRTGSFACSGDGVHLLKLHGSIDWEKEDEDERRHRPYVPSRNDVMPQVRITQVAASNIANGNFTPAVIFGQRNKLTADGPFLDLLRAFQNELEKVQVLTVIGYSFRDPHINVYISKWLNTDQSRQIRIINGPNFPDADVDYAQRLAQLSQHAPGRVQIVRVYAQEGLEQLFGAYSGSWNTPTPVPLASALAVAVETHQMPEASQDEEEGVANAQTSDEPGNQML